MGKSVFHFCFAV